LKEGSGAEFLSPSGRFARSSWMKFARLMLPTIRVLRHIAVSHPILCCRFAAQGNSFAFCVSPIDQLYLFSRH
jgi:hypothetical protein